MIIMEYAGTRKIFKIFKKTWSRKLTDNTKESSCFTRAYDAAASNRSSLMETNYITKFAPWRFALAKSCISVHTSDLLRMFFLRTWIYLFVIVYLNILLGLLSPNYTTAWYSSIFTIVLSVIRLHLLCNFIMYKYTCIYEFSATILKNIIALIIAPFGPNAYCLVPEWSRYNC